MNRQPVKSSNLASVGYDPDSKILEVEFHNATVFQYRNIPGPIFKSLMSAPSIGKYFNAKIRNGPYPWTQIK